jgi:hypothetical protein
MLTLLQLSFCFLSPTVIPTQGSEWGTTLPPKYFILGSSMTNSLQEYFLSFSLGHFMWAPLLIYRMWHHT